MALPPSKLTQVIEGLADDFSMKGRAIPGMLKKAGVKDEELKFAQLGLPEPNSQQAMEAWSKDQLKEANANRKDIQGVQVKTGLDADYGKINVLDVATPDYEERVYTFGVPSENGLEPNFRSEHFPADGQNYLAHTRIQPMDINGKKARTILELQSDLHASNRMPERNSNTELLAAFKENEGFTVGTEYEGWPIDKAIADLEQKISKGKKDNQVIAPYKDSINRKLLERELFNAVDEGALHTAIPIAGEGISGLQRSPEIQSVYENQIKNIAIKLAKQQGLDYRIETVKGKEALANDLQIQINKLANASLEGTDDFEATNAINKLSKSLNDQSINEAAKKYLTRSISKEDLLAIADKQLAGLKNPSEYLVIDHPKGTKLDLNLYASPVATAGAAYAYYEAGYSEDEVSKHLEKTRGYTPEEAKQTAMTVKAYKDAGYTQEEITKHLDSKEVSAPEQTEVKTAPAPARAIATPVSPDQAAEMTHASPTLDKRYYQNVFRAASETADNAKELVASQEVLRPAMVSSVQQTKAFAGYDNKTNELVSQKTNEQRQHIIDFAAQKGVQLEYDPNTVGWRVMTDKGWQEANPSIWDGIKKAKGEISASMVGAIAGSKYGRNAGITLFPEAAPISGSIGLVGGGIIGGAIGAVAGSELDYIYESMTHNAEMDAAVQNRRLLNAAQSSLIYDVIGGLAMKTPSAIKSTIEGVRSIPERIANKVNQTEAIDQALSDIMFLNRDEANDLANIMAKYSEVPGQSTLDKRVAASVLTQPGSEGVASAIASIDPLASRAIAKTIDMRAQDVLKTAENLTDDNLSILVRQDLKNYEDDVKNYYTTVKSKASEAPNAANYQFNIDKLAIDPVLDSLKKNIDDPRVMEKFLLQVSRIQQFSKSRDFNDLLELRKVVNDFKFNSKITSAKDFNRVNSVISNIDAAINEGAQKVLPNADAWLGEFKDANLKYAQMMNTKKNILYKALVKPGQDYDRTVSALTRYITADDSTFMDVVDKLPASTKSKVEGSVINALTEKYTAGRTGGERAVYFPQLSQSLDGITFTTPEARKFKGVIKELGEVFRNDVPLANVTGSLRPPTDTSILTSDLLAATKRSLASKMFNYAKRSFGSNSSKLVYKAAEVLENPLNTKSMKELMAEVDGKINIEKELQDLASAAAKEQADKGFIGAPKVVLYGNGNILSSKEGSGAKQTIALHRIATLEQATKIAESEGINFSDTKLLDAALTSLGYKAVQQGADKVRVLK